MHALTCLVYKCEALTHKVVDSHSDSIKSFNIQSNTIPESARVGLVCFSKNRERKQHLDEPVQTAIHDDSRVKVTGECCK